MTVCQCVKPSIENFSYLGRCVVWRATAGSEKLSVSHHVGQTEVSNLDIERLVQQQILGLQVPVDDIVSVTVVNTGDDLLEEPPSVLLLQLTMFHNVVKQFSTFMRKIQLFLGGSELCLSTLHT